jgi:hypothetical protein
MTLSTRRPFFLDSFKQTLLGRPTLLSASDEESVYADTFEVVAWVQWDSEGRASASSSMPGVFNGLRTSCTCAQTGERTPHFILPNMN